MPIWKLAVLTTLAALALWGCGRDDPQGALEAAAQSLQDSIGKKDTGALMERIHTDFKANQQLDRDWVKRTATLMFLRNRNVEVIALGNRSWIDPSYADKGYTEAQVTMTGAEGLLPERLGHYEVELEWWKEDGEWQLARLSWK